VAVKLLTIGEFARASRLSPKALRLYDELGLLPPAQVDEWSGYRYYAPSQLEVARLIGWLRRVGMPLAAIKEVAVLSPAEAADRVTAFLRVAEADFAERRELAEFLISYLSGRDTVMSATAISTTGAPAPVPLILRYAAASDPGLVRERNQDVAYADSGLLAVADGCGPAGERFAATVVDALRQFNSAAAGPAAPAPAELLNGMSDAVAAAVAAASATDAGDSVADSASTLTAMFWAGSRLAFVHIGDSRAYLLRDGGLFQITHDDSVVQSMIDAGRLTPEEAVSHPQRSLLLKALDATAATLPEAKLRDAQAGDRYLLCSDGLTSAVPVAAIRETLSDVALSPENVVARLIEAANAAGGPDNIACAVADVIPAA
jgi:serine/threonine protein phosphatase PrpC/DNA-binding transcriptional MerR regulator